MIFLSDITCNIICQLAKVTGTPSIKNEADIPIIFKYVEAFTSTNKILYAAKCDEGIVALFLTTLANRFEIAEEAFAAHWNSPGARKWLWNHCHSAGYFEHYQAILKIVALIQEANTVLQLKKIDFKHEIRLVAPNPYASQTKNGIAIGLGYDRVSLETPFGKIELIEGGLTSRYSSYSFAEQIIYRLGAQFDSLSCHHTPKKIIRISPPINLGTPRKIRKHFKIPMDHGEMDQAKESSDLICCRCGRTSKYRIKNLGNNPLPPSIAEVRYYMGGEAIRSARLIVRLWEMLQRNEEGFEPFGKSINTKYSFGPTIVETPLFKNIFGAEQQAIEILNKLESIVQKKDNWIFLILPCEQILLIRSLIRTALSKQPKHKLSFFCRKTTICIEQGEDNISISALKDLILIAIKELKMHWIGVKLSDFPDIPHKESEEEWSLFTKIEMVNRKEIDLISTIANQMGMDHLINCWTYESSAVEGTQFPYLWIKKDHLQKVKNAFGFVF